MRKKYYEAPWMKVQNVCPMCLCSSTEKFGVSEESYGNDDFSII